MRQNDNSSKYRQFKLTTREFEVLELLIEGKTNIQIAKELMISTHTVKVYICNILQKFGVKDRVQAAVKAIREGLVE